METKLKHGGASYAVNPGLPKPVSPRGAVFNHGMEASGLYPKFVPMQ